MKVYESYHPVCSYIINKSKHKIFATRGAHHPEKKEKEFPMREDAR